MVIWRNESIRQHIKGKAPSVSVGITFYPQDKATSADQLLRQADHAMYEAKYAGKNRYCVFENI